MADQGLAQTRLLMDEIRERLHAGFGIVHTTIQLECASCGQGRIACLNE
jgi:Co/Zn/Cd efflux system component